MENIVWQLPVIHSNKTAHDWIHPKAKYHAFIEGESVCGKYNQATNYFETSIEEVELMKNHDLACKACLKTLGIK